MDKNNHPWHSISVGENAPDVVNGIIEITQGTRAKYELHKESGMLMMDRVLYSCMHYPGNYGFIPKTLCEDKDPLDIIIFSQIDIVPMCIVPAKVIGVMHMVDGGEKDEKIIAVAMHDKSVDHMNDLSDLPEHSLKEVQNFFEDYKKLENKSVDIHGFGDAAEAREIVEKSMQMYQEKFNA